MNFYKMMSISTVMYTTETRAAPGQERKGAFKQYLVLFLYTLRQEIEEVNVTTLNKTKRNQPNLCSRPQRMPWNKLSAQHWSTDRKKSDK